MRKPCRYLLLFSLMSAALSAQGSHGVVIDNEYVRVINVTSPPHQKGAPHEHKVNRVMIYLNAGTQTLATPDGKADRLKWKANQVLWSPARGTHTSEVTSDQPVRIVEVELKDKRSGIRPAALDPVKVDPKHYKVDLENDQVRVVRAHYGPHEQGALHEHAGPRVVVYLTDEHMRVTTPDGKTEEPRLSAGEVRWAGDAKHSEVNLMDKPFEVLVVEVK